jgi:hypothetical protein
MKTWVLVKFVSGKEEWLEQADCDYAWQTGQIPGAKALKIVKSKTKPTKET